MIKTILLTISESAVSGMIILVFLYIFGFSIVKIQPKDVVESETGTEEENYENQGTMPWCYEYKYLKKSPPLESDDWCIKSIRYKDYDPDTDFFAQFRLYGASNEEEVRDAASTGETRVFAGVEMPICQAADKYEGSNYCYNDETSEVNLVAREKDGRTVIVSARDYHNVGKGFMAHVIGKSE